MMDDVAAPWALDPDTRLELRMASMRSHLEQGEFEQAVLEAEELLDEEPDYPDALYLLGEALLDANDPEGAVLAFGRHLEMVGEDLESLLRLGLAAYEICDVQTAEESVREVLRRQPDHALAHYQLSLVLEYQGRATESLSSLILANQLDPASFPLPNAWSTDEWKEAIGDATILLHPRLRRFWSDLPMHLEKAPTREDLFSSEPPMSPRTLGLIMRPAEAPDAPDQARPEGMRFFLRNLNRAVDYEELVTWLHASLEREACEWLGVDPDQLD